MSLNKQQNHNAVFRVDGMIKASLNGDFGWNGRFIIIGSGVHVDTDSSGYWDIVQPAAGTNISVVGGAARAVTAAAAGLTYGGIPLNTWETLWYRLPLEAGNSTINANFLIVPYTQQFDPDENWVMVASRSDVNEIRLGDGSTVMPGHMGTTSVVSELRNLRDQNNNWGGNGVLFVAPTNSGATPNPVGYIGQLRLRIGEGYSGSATDLLYSDCAQANAAAGTIVYDSTGAASGRVWRVMTAAELAKMGDPREVIGSLATATVFDLNQDEGLYWNPTATNTTTGTWHAISYSASGVNGQGFTVPPTWIRFAYKEGYSNSTHFWNGVNLATGDRWNIQDVEEHQRARVTRQSMAEQGSHGTAMCAWTPNPYFAGAGANGVLANPYGVFVKWVGDAAYAGIGMGYSSNVGQADGLQYVQLNMPSNGFAIPVLGNTAITRVVDPTMGIPLGPYEALYYVPPTHMGGNASVDAGWMIGYHGISQTIPAHAILVAQFTWAGKSPAGAVGAAAPFGGSGIGGGNQIYSRVWFMGHWLVPGTTTGPIGQLDTIGSTEGWRAFIYGAAAGASGAGNVAGVYAGWPAAYRIVCEKDVPVLRTKGILQFTAATTISAGNVLAFIPGVGQTNNHMFLAHGSSNAASTMFLVDLRLQAATVGGINGVQVVVSAVWAINGGSINNVALGAGAWLNMECINGIEIA
jgi:hypothetical protein